MFDFLLDKDNKSPTKLTDKDLLKNPRPNSKTKLRKTSHETEIIKFVCKRKSDQPTKSSQEELRVPIRTIFDVAEEKPTIARYFNTIEQRMRNTEFLPIWLYQYFEWHPLNSKVQQLKSTGINHNSELSISYFQYQERCVNKLVKRNESYLAFIYSIVDKYVEKTAFSTDFDHYEWMIMPVGLTNAPATFQQMMDNVLPERIDRFVQVYLDDIFIYSEDVETHGKHVKEVLSTLRKHKLITKKSKCRFFYQEFRFLGQVVTPICIQTALEKIKKVKSWPTPKTVKEAQSFIGLTSYYRRFIKGHSKIANPIHKFITKQSKWTSEQDEAFNQLKNALISIGSQLNYGIYDREFMAIVEALRTWRYYLMGRHFIVMTDHKSLIYLKNQNLIDSTKVARWMDFLPQFDFDIQEDETQRHSLTLGIIEAHQDLKKEIITGYKKDTNYALIFRTLRDKTKVPVEIKNHIKHFCYQDEVRYYKTLEIFKNAHDSKDACHFGAWKTYLNLKDSFYWSSMLAQIRKWVETCRICQQHNTNTRGRQGLFSPLPIPTGRWTDITMDFITGLPRSGTGYDMIMVVVDRFSKMAHFIPTHKRLNAAACARLFSDKDIRFMNKFWQTLHYLNGSSLLFSTTNHPETDGQTERVNKIVNQLLRKYSANDQLSWNEHLSMCELSYNSTYQDSIKASPFEIAYEYEPSMIRKVNSWDLEDNKYSPNAEEFVRLDLPVINLKDRESNVQWIEYYKENPNIYQEPPRTEREMLARINELSGIGGWSEEPGKEKTYDVFWKDCDQTLARKVPERIFNQADLSLRQSLMYNAKLIQEHEQV
ncbi:hypothetical protein JL09_g4729 [Pichia kudriavzevii]|uniref:Integrase catalytic domain-containing protein n=1 Tax=Pichia kudriavzevii TaxID=4909 RepID=A0A099NW25_PICKU|nr:hypothetical protein JL09_g4729 [Pichia kudriavzevii]